MSAVQGLSLTHQQRISAKQAVPYVLRAEQLKVSDMVQLRESIRFQADQKLYTEGQVMEWKLSSNNGFFVTNSACLTFDVVLPNVLVEGNHNIVVPDGGATCFFLALRTEVA